MSGGIAVNCGEWHMPERAGMNLEQRGVQSQKQQQRLIMLPQMQQAIQILQVPVMELSSLIESEMEQNPVLEYSIEQDSEAETPERGDPDWEPDDPFKDQETPIEKSLELTEENYEVLKQLDEDFRDHFTQDEQVGSSRSREEEKKQAYIESLISEEDSLYDHLMAQAREAFSNPTDLQIAEVLIGYLDNSGFLSTPLYEIALLHQCDQQLLEQLSATMRTFEPAGVFAMNLQDSLLLQLERKGKKHTLAYSIIQKCYEDLLHNRIPMIARKLHSTSSAVSSAMNQTIARLDFHPGAVYARSSAQQITPDVAIRQEGDRLIVDANEEPIPQFRINRRYLKMLDDPTLPLETVEFIKQKITSAKWLMRTIDQRNSTVVSIAKCLIERQADFFLKENGQLTPLTMKTLADELELHESTIARAVANKYIDSPRGILPLRFFFTNALETEKGEDVSSNTARDVMRKIVEQEDKRTPLSDDSIARLLNKQGIKCARRTVAKYRGELGFGNAQQRRQY